MPQAFGNSRSDGCPVTSFIDLKARGSSRVRLPCAPLDLVGKPSGG